ncbi:unnamed protein product [Aphanomyces euteiches]
MDNGTVEEDIARVRSNTIGNQMNPELLHPDCRGRIDQTFVNSWLSAMPRLDPPIHLLALKPNTFEAFLVSQKKADGQNPG